MAISILLAKTAVACLHFYMQAQRKLIQAHKEKGSHGPHGTHFPKQLRKQGRYKN